MAAQSADSLLAQLENDRILAPFFDSGFSPDEYVRDVISADSAGTASALDESASESELHRLRLRAGDIEGAIKALVSTHQDALFAQAGNTAALKRDVTAVGERVSSLAQLSTRLQGDILTPYAELKREARTLEHVLGAMDVLRRVQRLMFNVRRLRGLIGPALSAPAPLPQQQQASKGGAAPSGSPLSSDAQKLASDPRLLSRLAPVLREVEEGLADPAVAGVAVADAERAFVASAGAAVREATRSLLLRAVAGLNAADVGATLTILHDLGCAPGEVVGAVDGAVERGLAAVKDALDVRAVAAAAQQALEGGTGLAPAASGAGAGGKGSGMGMSMPGAASRGGNAAVPPAGSAAAWRGVLWSRVEGLCDTLQRLTLCVWSLLYVAARRRADATGHHQLQQQQQQQQQGGATGGPRGRESLVAALATALATGRGLDGRPPVHPAETDAIDGDGAGEEGGEGPAHPAIVLLRRFWRAVTSGLHAEIHALASSEASPFVRNTLADGYPRLHYALLDAVAKAGRSVTLRASDDGSSGEGGALLSGAYLFVSGVSSRRVLGAVSPLLRLYLGRSLTRLTEPVHAMFPGAHQQQGQGQGQQARGRGALHRVPSSSPSTGFTPPGELDRYMDERHPDPPSQAATGAYVKALLGELAACKPPPASGGGGGGVKAVAGPQLGSPTGATTVTTTVGPDPALYAAVARGVATSVKLLASKAEGASAVGPSAAAVGELWVPTPAQALNVGTAARLDDVRRAVARALVDLPVPPSLERLWAAVGDGGDAVVRAAAARRAEATPLRPPLPPHALALQALLPLASGASAAGGSASSSLAVAAASSAGGLLVGALDALDAQVDATLAPWVAALAAPLERTVARLTELGYVAVTPTTAQQQQGEGQPEGGAGAAPLLPASESEYVASLEAHAQALAAHQLALLPQGGHLPEAVRAALASRVLTLFVRLGCLVRPCDDHGRMRLARDAAGVEAAVSVLVHELPKLGRPYAQLRAFRPFLFLPSQDVLAAVTDSGSAQAGPEGGEAGAQDQRRVKTGALLRALRPANVAHALLCRMPRECSLPADSKAAAAVAPAAAGAPALPAPAAGSTTAASRAVAYSDWMDSVVATAGGGGAGALSRLFPSDRGLALADEEVLLRARACVDEYAQRTASTAAPDAVPAEQEGAATAPAAPLPEVLLLSTHAQALLSLSRAPPARGPKAPA